MATGAAGIVRRQITKLCKEVIEKKRPIGRHSRFISTAALEAPPVKAGDVKLINWDNFDRGSWSQDTKELPLFNFFMANKRRREAKLFAVQQERSTQYPDQEPYNFWETHAHKRVVEMRDAELFFKVAANLDALTCVLRTAPHDFNKKFMRKQRRLEDNRGMFLVEVRRLYNLRPPLVLFDYLPFYGEVQVHNYRKRLAQEEKARRKRNRKEANIDQRQTEPEPGYAANPEITSGSNINASGPSFTTQPELWAIKPFSSYVRISIGRSQTFHELRRLIDTSLRSTSVERHGKVSALLNSTFRNIADMLELDRDLRALQYYSIQRCPGSMLGGRVELGKEIWAKMKETSTDEFTD